MAVLRIILTVLFIIICIALTVLVLMQEGKAAGLGAISGAAETYWGKNKGRFHGRNFSKDYQVPCNLLYCYCSNSEYIQILTTKALLYANRGAYFFPVCAGFTGENCAALQKQRSYDRK